MKLKKGSIMKSLKTFTSIAVGSLLISASSLLACEVPVDIHPTSCPNPINVGSNGLVPAAMLGTGMSWMDVRLIKPMDDRGITMRAYDSNGELIKDEAGNVIIVKAVRAKFEDVATPFGDELDCTNEYSCTTNGPDGLEDLALKFPTQGKTKKVKNADGTFSNKYLPGVADLLKDSVTGETLPRGTTRCIEIRAWSHFDPAKGLYTDLIHGKDVIIVK